LKLIIWFVFVEWVKASLGATVRLLTSVLVVCAL